MSCKEAQKREVNENKIVFLYEKEIAAIFDEWLRRYEENPDGFAEEYSDGKGEYGEVCAWYFIKLRKELRSR